VPIGATPRGFRQFSTNRASVESHPRGHEISACVGVDDGHSAYLGSVKADGDERLELERERDEISPVCVALSEETALNLKGFRADQFSLADAGKLSLPWLTRFVQEVAAWAVERGYSICLIWGALCVRIGRAGGQRGHSCL
jgi:hypothetical protein